MRTGLGPGPRLGTERLRYRQGERGTSAATSIGHKRGPGSFEPGAKSREETPKRAVTCRAVEVRSGGFSLPAAAGETSSGLNCDSRHSTVAFDHLDREIADMRAVVQLLDQAGHATGGHGLELDFVCPRLPCVHGGGAYADGHRNDARLQQECLGCDPHVMTSVVEVQIFFQKVCNVLGLVLNRSESRLAVPRPAGSFASLPELGDPVGLRLADQKHL